jgi:hypothetical protein
MGRNIDEATHQEMRSLVCAQCHVEYYFRPGDNYLVFPWDENGITADAQEQFLDESATWTGSTPQPRADDQGAASRLRAVPEQRPRVPGRRVRRLPHAVPARGRHEVHEPPHPEPARRHLELLPGLPRRHRAGDAAARVRHAGQGLRAAAWRRAHAGDAAHRGEGGVGGGCDRGGDGADAAPDPQRAVALGLDCRLARRGRPLAARISRLLGTSLQMAGDARLQLSRDPRPARRPSSRCRCRSGTRPRCRLT